MPLTDPTTQVTLARVPFLNCLPFFAGLKPDDSLVLKDLSPRELGQEAAAGTITAGPLPVADFFRLGGRFARLGNLGIAVRGRCGSVLLLSRRPIRQLGGRTIGVTDQTSTSVVLLRLLLEQRYQLPPAAYVRGMSLEAEAILVIGDDALRMRAENRWYPYEFDLAFEWWLWQHLPMVFAVWAVRADASDADKQQLVRVLQRQLAVNSGRLGELVKEPSASIGLPEAQLQAYLENFHYRLSEPEEQGLREFERLVHEHHLL